MAEGKRYAVKYITVPLYCDMAKMRNLTPATVVYRATRRRRAALQLNVQPRRISRLRLDNPFIQLAAWHYLLRQSVRNAARHNHRRRK